MLTIILLLSSHNARYVSITVVYKLEVNNNCYFNFSFNLKL